MDDSFIAKMKEYFGIYWLKFRQIKCKKKKPKAQKYIYFPK